MSAIEAHARFKVHHDCEDEFRDTISPLIAGVRENEPGTLRYDWFTNGDGAEYFSFDIYADEAAMHAHQRNSGEQFLRALALADVSVELLGAPMAKPDDRPAPFRQLRYDFAYGLGKHSAAANFTAEARDSDTGHIEIYSKFQIEPGRLDEFKSCAAAVLDVVKDKDPGTIRYDWFYDDANLQCLAMDSYRDADALFGHMENASTPHARLLEIATTDTEFLGALPQRVFTAVAKYQPRIWTFHDGIKAYSSGGFG
ncbi:MAG: antibiotic biosynthesis monooxygenase [Halieaceae bacterium]|nr:antibiotic biosynthesis monooxygenase [Halieaceae bacterium]